MKKSNKLRKKLAWIPLGIYWPVLFVGTHIPLANVELGASDKLLHFSSYLVLTVLFWLARFGTSRPSLFRARVYKVILLFALYGMLDEVTQKFVHRHCDLADWIADMGGCLGAVVLLWVLRRPWQLLAAYWVGLSLFSHWPGSEMPFEKLPPSLQQFQVAYVMVGYLILTLLLWLTLSRQGHFVFNYHILLITLTILPFYALLDETVNLWIGRSFDWTDVFSGLGGIVLGTVSAWMLAQHYLVNQVTQTKPE